MKSTALYIAKETFCGFNFVEKGKILTVDDKGYLCYDGKIITHSESRNSERYCVRIR